MGQSVLVFISHSSEDKVTFIEPLVSDLEDCYINVWLDKRKIIPGDNLRKSIFKEGLDKADVALIFFTRRSLKSAWVDQEIKHVLREEKKKGNNFDLNKIIAIFDCKETYEQITERYPELTDDLLHLMPEGYDKIQLGQLISAIWSKYLMLQGGDVATQRLLLEKDKEIFQKDKDIEDLKTQIKEVKSKKSNTNSESEFKIFVESGGIDDFIKSKDTLFSSGYVKPEDLKDVPAATAFGLLEESPRNPNYVRATEKGKLFFKWLIIEESKKQ